MGGKIPLIIGYLIQYSVILMLRMIFLLEMVVTQKFYQILD